MLSVVFVIILVGRASAYNLYCSNHTHNTATFTPSDELGRYTTEICTRIKPNTTSWSVDLFYNDKTTKCNNTHHSMHPGKSHSKFQLHSLDEDAKNLNCTFVCLSTDFEMIFSSCYTIKSTLCKDGNDFPPYDTHHNITNKFNIQHFAKDSSVVVFNHQEDITIHFYTVASWDAYTVDLCPENLTNTGFQCPRVTENCTTSASAAGVGCLLAPPYGCYKIWLKLMAPWFNGVFANRSLVVHEFCFNRTQPEGVSGSDWSIAWACGALVLLSAAALLLWRLRDAIALHKRVLRYWTELSQESRPPVEEREVPCRHIVLVYAREGPAGQQVAEALRTALERGSGATVHDVFAPVTLAAAAAAGSPADWVRSLLARSDCRLVLLQTPALACLHPAPRPALGAGVDNASLTMTEPLLGGRAVYRVPHFGDTLAQFALRLLAHSSAHQQPPPQIHQDLPAYKKYYLSTLSELQTEVFPQVVPFRRYLLPEAAQLLVTHVAPARTPHTDPGLEPALQQLERATHEFVLHARNNPDYLLDELVFT